MAIDLYTPLVPEEQLHPSFVALRHRGFEPARRMLADVAATFEDKDGNFVKDFQTTSFDARLWELYLHAYLLSDGFSLDRAEAVPDYVATKATKTVCIEAVTVSATQAKEAAEAVAAAHGLEGWELFHHRVQNVYPMKFSSSLFTKMKKRYWEKERVKGKPFILAIEDFHQTGSMVWTTPAFESYLYGQRYRWWHSPEGELIVKAEPIGKHKHGAKEVPSGFFERPDAEHVGAVLFSNSGTISKFNRMGFLKGYRPERLALLRAGTCYNPDPDAVVPFQFQYFVGDPEVPEETWAQGLAMYHNPKALVPVPPQLFPGIAHHFLDDENRMRSVIPGFHPMSSFTLTLNGIPEANPGPGPSRTLLQMLEGKPPLG
jgi:hypothetical protein